MGISALSSVQHKALLDDLLDRVGEGVTSSGSPEVQAAGSSTARTSKQAANWQSNF
jgi:hypothetical protein